MIGYEYNMDTLVSVILPTYNGAKRIQGAIESVLGQSYASWELLVIDDGATDNTDEIVARFTVNDHRIKYSKNDTNLGIQKTLNRGLAEAKGKYIARIDDDDVWIDIDKLKTQIEFLENNQDHVLIGTGFVAVDEKGKEVFKRLNSEDDKSIRDSILSINCFVHSGVVFNRDVALQCGGYSTTLDVKHIEDYELWLKLGTLGKLANLPNYSVRLMLRAESISSKNKATQLKKSIQLIRKFKDNYPNYVSSVMSLYTRLTALMIFQIWPFRYFSTGLYKLYKNI